MTATIPTCTDCGHALHDSLGWCPNMASDNDCRCVRGQAVPTSTPDSDELRQGLESLQRVGLRGFDMNPTRPMTGWDDASWIEYLRRHDDYWRAEVRRLLAAHPEPVRTPVIDAAHLFGQREWSERTFGPGARLHGVLDHICKELAEIEADPTDVTEWIDVVILALDGAWRAGWEPQQIIDAIKAKQARNEARTWPDWRTASPDHAIEHIAEPGPMPDSADDATVGERELWHLRERGRAYPATPPTDDANRAPVSGGLDEGEREALDAEAQVWVLADELCTTWHDNDGEHEGETVGLSGWLVSRWACQDCYDTACTMVDTAWLKAERDTARREAGERIAVAIEALSVLDDDMRRRDAETMRSRAALIARADALTSDDGSGA